MFATRKNRFLEAKHKNQIIASNPGNQNKLNCMLSSNFTFRKSYEIVGRILWLRCSIKLLAILFVETMPHLRLYLCLFAFIMGILLTVICLVPTYLFKQIPLELIGVNPIRITLHGPMRRDTDHFSRLHS
ncbi:hypothetical protein EGR_10726 [Echinococcus granulosus]|uniref:Uncharacterized protein n=1 Tax=Echinococcus granulosus TaxID=6210 RepID=W6U060_ECHGR|nr:hypothetical protein EGR_10726 [Echinococcus granulosus]EUB54413.1 hypothetical protein EGR_10726 [Echinococcus granulosus]